MDIEKIIGEMCLEDKISLCSGRDCWNTKAMERYGIPSFKMSDGPHGLRCQDGSTDMLGLNKSQPATCFPTAVTAGAAWNTELFAREGAAIATEALSNGVSVVLGPGCNIKRNPLCGRNFEYLSEDPYLSGRLAAEYIKGQQNTGVGSSLKHFAANSQEYKRMNSDSQIDIRTLREIYLAAFETAVREAKPETVMCAYNKLNGVHCGDSKWLLTDLLRDEWGFDGLVVTDWGALNDRVQSYKAGCDLMMPGGSAYMEEQALKAASDGTLDMEDIDACVRRILKLAEKSQSLEFGREYDKDAHHELAREIAREGAVLLKNENGILPVTGGKIALIGYMAKDFRYQGAGSSHINPNRLECLTDALPQADYISCCDADGAVTEEALLCAAETARKAQTAIVVAGLPDCYESEGYDRDNMKMPEGHLRMIEAVAEANPNSIVVLLGGSPMELPFYDKVRAILFMGLSGQAGALACADILTGRCCPSGKLTETWALSYDDVISKSSFGAQNVEYREGIYVGYRYYDKAKVVVRFPFGFGLSYTSFEYSDLRIDGMSITATIKNTGSVAGAEVVQLYIAPPADGIFRPEKELKGFAKIALEPGESAQVSFTLSERSFSVWRDGWRVPAGEYTVLLAASAKDIRLEGKITMQGESVPCPQELRGSFYETLSGAPSRSEWEKLMGQPVPALPRPRRGEFTMDCSCLEMRSQSAIMKLMYKVVESVVAKSFGGKKDYSDPAFKMMMVSAVDCPLRSVVQNVPEMLSENQARGLLAIANGHFLKGIGTALK